MPKVILEFQLPEEQEEYEAAMQGGRSKVIIDDIWGQIFRPHFKHGYCDEELQKLTQTKNGSRIIELLSEIYREVVNNE